MSIVYALSAGEHLYMIYSFRILIEIMPNNSAVVDTTHNSYLHMEKRVIDTQMIVLLSG